MALILCTGANPVLMATRQLILERSGHKVISVNAQDALITACNEHAFDVAVIGQALAAPVKKRVFSLIREHCPSAKVLELYTNSTNKVLENADSWLEAPVDVPQEFAERVNALVVSK